MKKILIVLLVSLSAVSFAQSLEFSALAGAAPYKISAGIKNSTSGAFYVSAAFSKMGNIDVGVQIQGVTSVTMCSVITPGAFMDMLIKKGDNTKHIFLLGAHAGYALYGSVKTPGAFYKDNTIDSVNTKVDNAVAYGLRAGYKFKVSDHLFIFALASPTYCMTKIKYENVGSINVALLYVPVMVGVSVWL